MSLNAFNFALLITFNCDFYRYYARQLNELQLSGRHTQHTYREFPLCVNHFLL